MKFKLTDETILHNGIILHRIECIEAFSDVKVGDKGGFIKSELNLSQEGYSWIYDDAMVYNNAMIYGDATVYENAKVYDTAEVYENAKVYGDVDVCYKAKIHGDAQLYSKALVGGFADVYGNAWIFGNAIVHENARVFENARICGNAQVYGNAEVYGGAQVYGDTRVFGEAKVYDDADVYGIAEISGDAKITSTVDYLVFKNNWSSGRHFTWTRSNNKWRVGCFYGTGEELIEKAYKDSKQKGDCYKATVNYVENIVKLTSNE